MSGESERGHHAHYGYPRGTGGMPERETDPRDDRTGWERDRDFVCGCGRGCTSWPDHFARVKAEVST